MTITPPPLLSFTTVETIAGQVGGSADGPATTAKFNRPDGTVADTFNYKTIRRIR